MSTVPVYLIPAPIGSHLSDMALSSLQHLAGVRHVFIETNGRTIRKLRGAKRLTAGHTLHVIDASSPDLATQLITTGQGFAILADTGTPCFVDPGHTILDRILTRHRAQVRLVPLGMSSALDAALAMCGLDSQRFAFVGHHPENVDYTLAAGHRHPVVLYLHGGSARTWSAALSSHLPGWRRATLFCNIRNRRGMRIYRLTPGSALPDDLRDETADNYVAVIEQL